MPAASASDAPTRPAAPGSADRVHLPSRWLFDHLPDGVLVVEPASNPSLSPELRAHALEAVHGARQVAAVLESMPGVFPISPPRPSA